MIMITVAIVNDTDNGDGINEGGRKAGRASGCPGKQDVGFSFADWSLRARDARPMPRCDAGSCCPVVLPGRDAQLRCLIM